MAQLVYKARAFVFTLNNWTEQEYEKILKLKYNYIVIGDEIAPSTGTPHLQGYVHFKSPTSSNTIRSHIPRAWFEQANGTAEQNFDYSRKEYLKFEDGKRPAQGKRKDIDHIKEYVQETPNANMADIIDHYPTNNQTIKYAETLLKYKEKGRTTKPKILWYHGETGTGKTHTAYEEHPDAYIKDNEHKWFEGYDAHETIIIDDMRYDTFKYNHLLRILDRYPNRLECKGGSRQNLAHTIIITAPQSPQEMFENKITENIGQLLRRIDEIKIFT
jgi:hypothetical protein